MTLSEYLGAGSGVTKLLWHLNGNSNDSSGNGNNGADTSIDYGLDNGYFGQGALINNVNDQIIKATDLGINGEGAITVVNWIKLTSEITSGVSAFWVHRSTAVVDRYFQLNYDYNGGTRRLNLWAGGPNYYNIALGISKWYCFIATRASGASPAVALYMDGFLIISGIGGIGGAGQNQFTLGYATVSQPSKNDEIIIENKVWSQQQIQKYYTWAKGRYAIQ